MAVNWKEHRTAASAARLQYFNAQRIGSRAQRDAQRRGREIIECYGGPIDKREGLACFGRELQAA